MEQAWKESVTDKSNIKWYGVDVDVDVWNDQFLKIEC